MPQTRQDALVKKYKALVRGLGKNFVSSLDRGNMSTFSRSRNVIKDISKLSREVKEWLARNVQAAYRDEQKRTQGFLRSKGLKRTRERAELFNRINDHAVRALLDDPYNGFVPRFTRSLFDMKRRIKSVTSQARNLKLKGETFDSLYGEGSVDIKVFKEMLHNGVAQPSSSPDLFSALSLIPFVRISTKRGPRHIRVDRFVKQSLNDALTRTRSVAMRNKLLEYDQKYIRLKAQGKSGRSPSSLYAGKVFALSREAAADLSVPYVGELPNGGAPIHPNSKLAEVPWLEDNKSMDNLDRPPAWALNRPFELVRIEFNKRKIPK